MIEYLKDMSVIGSKITTCPYTLKGPIAIVRNGGKNVRCPAWGTGREIIKFDKEHIYVKIAKIHVYNLYLFMKKIREHILFFVLYVAVVLFRRVYFVLYVVAHTQKIVSVESRAATYVQAG